LYLITNLDARCQSKARRSGLMVKRLTANSKVGRSHPSFKQTQLSDKVSNHTKPRYLTHFIGVCILNKCLYVIVKQFEKINLKTKFFSANNKDGSVSLPIYHTYGLFLIVLRNIKSSKQERIQTSCHVLLQYFSIAARKSSKLPLFVRFRNLRV